ncbi:MAG TPA: glycosyltransferase family 9 protein [Stellaceae bacterium]|nr:glycosyltransferase family 9 protein [Stellaceae bacterium]
MAPLANKLTRDWPLDSFRRLAIMCAERLDAVVNLVGSGAQRHSVNTVIRGLPADRYINRCGVLNWDETRDLIRGATCVVANNSGVGHLAAELGVPVVSVFGASHSPLEWMPRGGHVSVIVRHTGCSPCSLDTNDLAECPYDVRCLTDLDPAHVFEAMRRLIARAVTPPIADRLLPGDIR